MAHKREEEADRCQTHFFGIFVQTLSDDWTKQLHLQTDRTLELHSQGGFHHRVRIPKFGRALGYHFPSAEALVGAAGNQVYRLNLDHGRFMAPFQMGDGLTQGQVTGCNSVDVNPAHGLLAFGTEGAGIVELWDQRARRRAGALNAATPTVLDAALANARRGLPALVLPGEDANEVALTSALGNLSISALCSAQDGLNIAVGTSTGHTLLYDLRMDMPYSTKDQGFSLPIKSLSWPGDVPARGSGPTAPQDVRNTVLSADAKGIKIWRKDDAASNIVAISPQSGCDINDVHHLPGTGLIFAAIEGTQCAAWYVPTIGPAPRWCSFLDRLTDEMDEEVGSGGKRGVYEDFKFVDKEDLNRLGMSHLIGSEVLRPYMHGYFISLPLYERARLVANPTAYSDAREKALQAKLEKKAESRIRSSGAKRALENLQFKVNKTLAERVAREQAREESAATARGDAEEGAADLRKLRTRASLLSDERFKELFTNPEFEVDEKSREFALLNPSSAAGLRGASKVKICTAMEEEESDRASLSPDVEEDRDQDNESSDDEADSDDEGDLQQFDPRKHAPGTRRQDLERAARAERKSSGAKLVDDDDNDASNVSGEKPQTRANRAAGALRKQTLESRLRTLDKVSRQRKARSEDGDEEITGSHSISWTPSTTATKDGADSRQPSKKAKFQAKHEAFGIGLSRNSHRADVVAEELNDGDRYGRSKRRNVARSASGNKMRARS